jgi:CRISPR-associated protein Csm1
MADDSAGIKRVGVLRMDVDDFGRAMVAGLERRTMALTSALSSALELFFSGWLNRICDQVQRSAEMLPGAFERTAEALLYVIYAGGDDLFIVGTWDRLPPLAERIHHDFAAFAGHNPHLHISAGLTLERRKFPLYRAAERAHDALEDGAKEHTRQQGGDKDAITFLGQTVGWEVFAPYESAKDPFSVKSSTRELVGLLDRGIPRSLLQMVQSIYGQFLRDRDRNLERRPTCKPTDEQLYYGRWMWLQAYQIARLRNQHKEVEAEMKQLQDNLMDLHNVQNSGLAARWAEYLTRKE